jgi:hypothetical protein
MKRAGSVFRNGARTLTIMTLNTMTLSIMTLSIMTLSIAYSEK